MKTLYSVILENFVISHNTKKQFNIDKLNSDNIILYKASNDEDANDINLRKIKDKLDIQLTKKHWAFIAYKENSLGEIYKKYSTDQKKLIPVKFLIPKVFKYKMNQVLDFIFTDEYQEYEIRLVGGHLEIDCIKDHNNKITYYIYALTQLGAKDMGSFCNGDINNIDNFINDTEHKYIEIIKRF